MTKAKPAAEKSTADEGYWEHEAALLPLFFKYVPAGTGDLGSDVTVKPGRPVLMKYVEEKAERKRFYEALLEVPWLDPGIRRATSKALGRSLRKQNVQVERARTMGLLYVVEETAARMRRDGERPPKGDILTAAIEEVAEKAGIEPDALRKRFQRL